MVRANAAQQLNLALAGLGRTAGAYQALSNYVAIKKALNSNESIQKVTSYNFDLDLSVKQRLLAQQQLIKDQLYQQDSHFQRVIIYIFIIVIIVMIAVIWNYYRQKLKQQKINQLLKASNADVMSQKAALDEQAYKLNDLNAMKDRLIAILAHDLRAPLSTLRGLFDLLQDDSLSHDEILKLIPVVIKRLEYTSDFLDTLLFWINSQMENFEHAYRNFAIGDVIGKIARQLEEQVQSKGIVLEVNAPAGLIAKADPDSVGIVIRNLITNAIKFCDKGDVIKIMAEPQHEDVLITVVDTGTGMQAEQARQLFKNRVESQIGTRQESGTGMGLLFCKDLVEKSGGKIWVTSQEGKGSEFHFTVPAAAKA